MIGIRRLGVPAKLGATFTLAGLLCPFPALAAPANLCVTCSEPAQTYVCSVDSPLSKGNQALQFYCIVKLAKEGGHKSCAVSKTAEGQCAGLVKTYRYDGPDIPAQLRSNQGDFVAAQPPPSVDGGAPKEGPPETLVEAAKAAPGAASRVVRNVGKGTGEKVGNAAKGAGSAAKSVSSKIGDAARNAYDCVTSLFRGCGSRPE